MIAKEEYERNQSYNDGDGGKKHFGSLKEMVDKYYLRKEQHVQLNKYCEKHDISFCSTPFSNKEVDLLSEIGVNFYKVASMDINNVGLLSYIAKKQKPILLSTGMATITEVAAAVDIIEKAGNEKIIILHCISIYPPDYIDIHLNNIKMFQKTFKYPVGFSDHTIGTAIPLASVALGACVIEKHFTLDKDLAGWDHQISADPTELKHIVRESKNVQRALGNLYRTVSDAEKSKILKFRRSVVVNKALTKGSIIQTNDLEVKRPGTGIPADKIYDLVGRELLIDIKEDQLLQPEMLK